MSGGPIIPLDFAARRGRPTLLGSLILAAGLLSLGTALIAYHGAGLKKAGLELKLAAASRSAHRAPSDPAAAARLTSAAAGVVRELGAPWTAMLSDLEAASAGSKDDLAVLAVEPDHDKHRVRISGESKNLGVALAYLERLQKSSSLVHPMLDSHEIVADDNEHPVRFALTADWRDPAP